MVLVETNGNARSQPMETVDAKSLRSALEPAVDVSSQIVTDEHVAYPLATSNVTGGHQTVNHSKEE